MEPVTLQDLVAILRSVEAHKALAFKFKMRSQASVSQSLAHAYLMRSQWHNSVANEYDSIVHDLERMKGGQS